MSSHRQLHAEILNWEVISQRYYLWWGTLCHRSVYCGWGNIWNVYMCGYTLVKVVLLGLSNFTLPVHLGVLHFTQLLTGVPPSGNTHNFSYIPINKNATPT